MEKNEIRNTNNKNTNLPKKKRRYNGNRKRKPYSRNMDGKRAVRRKKKNNRPVKKEIPKTVNFDTQNSEYVEPLVDLSNVRFAEEIDVSSQSPFDEMEKLADGLSSEEVINNYYNEPAAFEDVDEMIHEGPFFDEDEESIVEDTAPFQEVIEESVSEKLDDSEGQYVEEHSYEIEKTSVPSTPKSHKKKRHFGYHEIFFFWIFVLFLFLFTSLFFLLISLEYKKEAFITYKETSDVHYKVCLKDNEFHNDECLSDETPIYVADSIHNIPITFSYDFNIDGESDVQLEYSIVGKIIIEDESGDKILLEKDYTLLSNEIVDVKNNKQHIEKEIVIDYDKFRNIASVFHTTYGSDTKDNLKVYFKIHKVNYDSEFPFDKEDEVFVVIPLTEDSQNILIQSENLNHKEKILKPSNVSFQWNTKNVGAFILLILSVYPCYKLIVLFRVRKHKKKTMDMDEK